MFECVVVFVVAIWSMLGECTLTINLWIFNSGDADLYIHTQHISISHCAFVCSKKYYRKLYCLERVSRSAYLSSTYECGEHEVYIYVSISYILYLLC